MRLQIATFIVLIGVGNGVDAKIYNCPREDGTAFFQDHPCGSELTSVPKLEDPSAEFARNYEITAQLSAEGQPELVAQKNIATLAEALAMQRTIANAWMVVFWTFVLSAIVSTVIGSYKGEPIAGFFAGALLGPIGVVLALISRGYRRPCQYCHELIHRDAKICPHCRCEITRSFAHR